MKLVNEIAALSLDIANIDEEIDSLYARRKELKAERAKKIERLKELTRQGKTLEQLEEMERSESNGG
ncbi:MAG: hypothetical protein HFI90_06930 [Clostridia bacterium]|nr:hypothetical protein [Clostridia bacterium]